MIFCQIKDIEGDFWKQNPQLGFMKPFASFKKKKNSSKIMKAIYMIFDSKSNQYASSNSEQESMKDVSENFMNDINFPWDKYEDIIDAYKDKCRSELHKNLEVIRKQVKDIEIASTTLSLSDEIDVDTISKLYKMKKDMISDAIDLEIKLKEEVSQQLFEGDYAISMIEGYALNN